MLKFDRPTLVTLTAPTCSGKSHLLNALTEQGIFGRIVSTTTRAPRANEVEGVDYNFITEQRSKEIEAAGEFFELIEFNGTRYGVTNAEMNAKMGGERAPIVILEPQGLQIYQRECQDRGWDVFKIYVNTVESVRLDRLLQRTLKAVNAAVEGVSWVGSSKYSGNFQTIAAEKAQWLATRAISEHHRRVLSITGDERHWQNRFSWDAIVPGDNLEEAIKMIGVGINWKNHKNSTPKPYTHRP